MFMTLEECVQSWKEAGQYGSKEERIARNARWIPFYSYSAQSQLNSTAPTDPHAREVVHVLEDAGVYKCTPKGREDFMRFVDSL